MQAETSVATPSHGEKRYAFLLKLKPGMEEAYDQAHRSVPQDLIDLLRRVGIREYSIFRRGQLLFLTLTVGDFDRAWEEMDNDPAYLAWGKTMAPFFEAASDAKPGERFPMLDEVFYMA